MEVGNQEVKWVEIVIYSYGLLASLRVIPKITKFCLSAFFDLEFKLKVVVNLDAIGDCLKGNESTEDLL